MDRVLSGSHVLWTSDIVTLVVLVFVVVLLAFKSEFIKMVLRCGLLTTIRSQSIISRTIIIIISSIIIMILLRSIASTWLFVLGFGTAHAALVDQNLEDHQGLLENAIKMQ